MPRGQKSKLRARVKRQQARGNNQALKDAQATEAEEGEWSSSSTLVFENASYSVPAAGIPQKPPGAQATSSLGAQATRSFGAQATSSLGAQATSSLGAQATSSLGAQATRSFRAQATTSAAVGASGEDAESHHEEENPQSLYSTPDTGSGRSADPLTNMAGVLVQFLLQKFNLKEPVTKEELLKIISIKYEKDYPEIIKRTADRLELVFGLEMKEIDPSSNTYIVVTQMNLPNDGRLDEGSGFPKNGLLMPLLGVILINEDRVPEDEMWDFLNMLGLYDGRKHYIFGEPRKLITKDLVQEGYLEYHQVSGSSPPTYEFLWGPRAHAETSKMKVLEFLAKINGTTPSSFQYRYQEAVRDEEYQAQASIAGRAGTVPYRPVFD